MTIAAILKHKNMTAASVASVSPGTSIAEVSHVLAARRIGAVLVQDAAQQLLGILSERDIIREIAEHGADALRRTAAQAMTQHPHTATPQTTVREAMTIMTEGRFRHLPVIEHGCLVGIVSIGDVVNARLQDQACEVDNLRAYVAG
jgi:CBS domain-containing protein